MPISSKFHKRFIELVENLEESNKATIAKQMDVNYVTFSKIYNYGILPKVTILIRIADFFNVSIEYLLYKTNDEYFDKAQNPISFIERLNELKEKKAIKNYSELSNKVHIHRNSFYEWEQENHLPSIEFLEILADYFNVSMDYLLGRTDDSTPYDHIEDND